MPFQYSENNTNYSKIVFSALGTLNQITVYEANTEPIIDMAVKRIYEIEDRMSAFKADSDVSNINRLAGITDQTVNKDTFYVIDRASYYSNLSGGAFNLLIRPLVNLWSVNTDHARIPADEEIRMAMEKINYKDVSLDDKNLTVKLQKANQSIDLGAIAKGYAADEAKAILKQNNVQSAMIDLGGNIYAVGSKADGTFWNIGIQDPLGPQGSHLGIVSVKDKSIVTSGNYERFFIKDGVRYHHIIDPRTGYPSSNGIISATIISDASIDGDGLSTCAYVMGLEEGFNLISSIRGADAILITEDKNIYLTSGIESNFKLTNSEYCVISTK